MARIRSSRKPAATLPNVKRPSGPVRTPMFVPAMVTSAPTTGSLVAVAVTVPSTEPVCAPSGRAMTARLSVTATYQGSCLLVTKCYARRGVSRRPLSQGQLQARIIEPTVDAELRDPAAVDEAAEADVRGLLLLIREGIEDVAPAHGESHPAAHLVA